MLLPEGFAARNGVLVHLNGVGFVFAWHTAHGEEEKATECQEHTTNQNCAGMVVELTFDVGPMAERKHGAGCLGLQWGKLFTLHILWTKFLIETQVCHSCSCGWKLATGKLRQGKLCVAMPNSALKMM